MTYAGDVSPSEAYELLTDDPDAALVDVRTQPEWTYVGVPDLSQLGKQVVTVEWQRYPDGAPNQAFLDELAAARGGPAVAAVVSADSREWGPDTVAVRGGLARSGFDENAEALFLTQSYVYDSAAQAEAAFAGEVDHYIYSRYGNPTVAVFEERLRLLEGAEACFATATGMAAVFTSLAAFLRAGDRVVASRALFGSCFVILDELLPRWGISTEFVDGHELDQWEKALATPAQAVFFETPSNPMQDLVDVRAVCDLAHAAGARVVVDNVFATPLLQRPLELGADIVVYSATKHIDGQGRISVGLEDVDDLLEDLDQALRGA